MITFKCRECSKRIFVKDELAGRRVQCPACYKYLAVPKVKQHNWHLRGLAAGLLTVVIIAAIAWLVMYYNNGS